MLDFVLIGFGVLFFIVLILASNPSKPSSTKSDAVLTVTGESQAAFKTSSGTYEYRYDDLKNLAVQPRPKDAEYYGPRLDQLLQGITYSSLLFYSSGSKKVQKLMTPKDIGGWIIAIEKREKPLSWAEDGPYLLYKKGEKDKSKFVPRLLRIEAK